MGYSISGHSINCIISKNVSHEFFIFSSLINIDGEFYHSAASTAEGHNASIVIASPEYLIAPATLVTASLSSYSIISDPAAPYRLEIFVSEGLNVVKLK